MSIQKQLKWIPRYFDTDCQKELSVEGLEYFTRTMDEQLEAFGKDHEDENGFVLWSIRMDLTKGAGNELLGYRFRLEGLESRYRFTYITVLSHWNKGRVFAIKLYRMIKEANETAKERDK